MLTNFCIINQIKSSYFKKLLTIQHRTNVLKHCKVRNQTLKKLFGSLIHDTNTKDIG